MDLRKAFDAVSWEIIDQMGGWELHHEIKELSQRETIADIC